MEAGLISSLLVRSVAIGVVAGASWVLSGVPPVQARQAGEQVGQRAGQQAGEPAGQQAGAKSGAGGVIVLAQAGSPLNARRAVIDGIKSYEAGQYANAVTSLSIALQGEGLTSKDTAKAMYYRGRAYKQLKKFPEAIADLTSALWLKDGLSEAERQSAEADRKSSYASVGVASPATVARANTAALAAPAAAAAPAAPAPSAAGAVPARTEAAAPVREVAVPVKPVEIARPLRETAAARVPAPPVNSAWSTSVGTTAASPSDAAPQAATRTAALSGTGRARGYSPDSTSDGLIGFPAGTAAPAASSPPPAAAAAPVPAAPSAPLSNPLQQVGSFFSNMTNAITGGGSSSAPTAKPAPSATASTSPAAASGSTTAVSAWNSGTEVAAARVPPARPAQQTAALAPAKPAGKAASSAPGKFRLQLAAVRSRNEAERLARDLASRHRSALGSYVPEIDETVYGNMGTFYRVQVGPFASASEPQSLCDKIKSSGFDCLITGN